MKPYESTEAAQKTFDEGRAEQAMIDGLGARRDGLARKISSLVNRFPCNMPLDASRPSSDAFLFHVDEVEGRRRRMFVNATSMEDSSDNVVKAGLNFYVEVYDGEVLGRRKVIALEVIESGTVMATEFMSEYLPIIETSNIEDVSDRVMNEPKVRQLESIEESLALLYGLNQSVVLLPELAP